jgi:hypothetical protein
MPSNIMGDHSRNYWRDLVNNRKKNLAGTIPVLLIA